MLIGFIIDSLYTEKKSFQTIGDSILFLFYFPRVISGPIDRKNNFNKQIDDCAEKFKKKVDQMKQKYDNMLKLKVNIREKKLKRILEDI